MGTDSPFERSHPPRLPPQAVQHRIRFVEQPGDGQTVLMEFTDPVVCKAVEVTPGSSIHGPDDALDILIVPGNARDEPSTTDELLKWVMEKERPGLAPPLTITLHGAQIVWQPHRAALLAAPERTQSLLLALVDFSFYERELSKLERTTAEAWPQLEADMALAFEVNVRDLERLESVGRQMQQMLLVRMRHARLVPRMFRPGAQLPSLANQLGERLREIARIEDRLEALAGQLEVFDRVYEMSSQRLSEFRLSKHETTLEWVIIVLLATETLLLLIEVILTLERTQAVRYLSIDILRGVAIVLMIQVHFTDNLSSAYGANSWLYAASALLGLVPAPFFTFVSGVSYCLWLRKQQAAGRNEAEITKVTLRRGLFLFGAGIAFNVLVWLPEDTFNWDILTLIGSGLLFLAYGRKLPAGVLAVMCVLIVILSPLLRAALDYSAYWMDQSYSYDFTLTDVLSGFLANGYFPLLPWLVFPVMGFVIGEAIFPRPGRPVGIPKWVYGTAIGLMLLSLLLTVFRTKMPGSLATHYITGFTLFPASTEYTVGMLGLSMACLALLRRWIDRNAKITGAGWFLTFWRRYSAFSLTVYVLHHLAHLWPLWVYGTWKEDDPTSYWRKAMSVPAALGLAAVFVVLCYVLLIVLERRGRYGFESLMRWLCD